MQSAHLYLRHAVLLSGSAAVQPQSVLGKHHQHRVGPLEPGPRALAQVVHADALVHEAVAALQSQVHQKPIRLGIAEEPGQLVLALACVGKQLLSIRILYKACAEGMRMR